MSDPTEELIGAVVMDDSRLVKKCLAAGADPNAGGVLGMGANTKIAQLLLDAGANVNLAYYGITPLMAAVSRNKTDKVELFLAHGAEVNLMTEHGTALIHAVFEDNPKTADLLLNAGADPSIVCDSGDWKGQTCIDVAKEFNRKKVLALLESRTGGKSASKPTTSKAPSKPATIASTWERIEAEIKRLKWAKSRKLNKGASTASLAKVEKTLGVSLPDEFRESYALHDGQDSGTPFLLGPSDEGYCLLPLAQVLKEAKIWADLKDDFADEEVSADKGIRADWWNTKWLPIAGNGGGDFLCLDLAPAKGGQLGQIITMNHESPTRELWAKSFGEWLHSVAEQLKDVEA